MAIAVLRSVTQAAGLGLFVTRWKGIGTVQWGVIRQAMSNQ